MKMNELPGAATHTLHDTFGVLVLKSISLFLSFWAPSAYSSIAANFFARLFRYSSIYVFVFELFCIYHNKLISWLDFL